MTRHPETEATQYRYWKEFCDFVQNLKSQDCITLIKPGKPPKKHWIEMKMGRKGFKLCAVAVGWKFVTQPDATAIQEIRAEVLIEGEEAKNYYTSLKEQRAEIEAELGESLIWCDLPKVKRCKIHLCRQVDLSIPEMWSEHYQWLVEKLDQLYDVFSHRIGQL